MDSPLIHWFLWAVYVVGFLLCWRTASWIFATDGGSKGGLDGEDIVWGLFMGAILSLAWPVVVPLRIAYTHDWLAAGGRGIHQGFMRPPKAERERALRQKVADRDREIRALERQFEADGTLTPRGHQ